MSVVDKIQHYQRSLEKCADNGTRTLHCIEKLYRLPVTVQHLQETGVGRTVNALRKYDGSIGDAAKVLVAKWKTMVVDEDTSNGEDEDEACFPDASEGYSDRSNSPKPERKDQDRSSVKNSSKHRSNETGDKSRGGERRESRSGGKNSSDGSRSRESESKSSKKSSEERHRGSKNGPDGTRNSDKSETKNVKKSKSEESGRRESSSREEKSRRDSSTSNKSVASKSEDERKNSNKVSSSSGASRNRSRSDRVNRKRKMNDSLSEREASKKRKNSEPLEDEKREDDAIEDDTADDDDDDDDDNDDDNDDDDDDDEDDEDEDEIDDGVDDGTSGSIDDDDRPAQRLSKNRRDSNKMMPDTSFGSNSDDDRPSIKIKQERPDSPPCNERESVDSASSHKTKSSKSRTRDNAEKPGSSVADKCKRDNEKRDKPRNEKNTSKHRKNEKRKDGAKRSPTGESSSKSKSRSKNDSAGKNRTSKDDTESRESSKKKSDGKSENGSKESKEKFKEPKEKKIKKKKMNEDDGIDSNSGASFAEALGMCQDRPSSRKKNAASPNSSLIKTIKTEPGTSSATPVPSSTKSPVKIKTEPGTDSQALSLLAPNVKLEPLSVDLASTLPEISPNYKPLPAHYSMNSLPRKQDEDKVLSDAIYSRGQRTKVYSGNKSGYSSVPTLCEVCIRVLIQHMDALGFTGGIPYDILKPVLERAMPDQLFTLENYNPYLIEDTDPLWQFHCQREFREKQREEMESWRDMYMRCRDEREVKLKALTANIKESIDKSVPVRSTKLAYVDNVVKPPRNVLRNQAKHGTAKSSTSSSDLKKQLILSGSGGNSATNISVPPPPMSRTKSTSSSMGKKNKAPLMAKALQLIKARYKR